MCDKLIRHPVIESFENSNLKNEKKTNWTSEASCGSEQIATRNYNSFINQLISVRFKWAASTLL